MSPEERKLYGRAYRSRVAEARRRERRIRLAVYGVLGLAAVLILAGLFWSFVLEPQRALARVNGAKITWARYWTYRKEDLAQQIQTTRQLLAQFGANELLQEQLDQLQAELQDPKAFEVDPNTLERAIQAEILRQGARELGIQVSPQEVEEELLRGLLLSEAATVTETRQITATLQAMGPQERQARLKVLYQQVEAQWGLTPEEYRWLTEDRILQRKVLDYFLAQVPKEAEQVHARHILFGNPETARRAYELLTTQPETYDFAVMARTYSEDPGSKDLGGDLGWFPRGVMVPEFEEVAFSLPEGQISEPVKTRFGYHIIQVIERDPARPLDETLRLRLARQKMFNWIQEELLSRYQVEPPPTPTPTPQVTPTPTPIDEFILPGATVTNTQEITGTGGD